VATAHKIARVGYHRRKDRAMFQAMSAIVYERDRRERELKHLSRRARKLGCALIAMSTSQLVPASYAPQSLAGFSGTSDEAGSCYSTYSESKAEAW
jgi:hypothetical protein